jgi:NADH-quinone oxidoreductase subunit L
MLSAIAHTALATVAMAGGGDGSHGLPAGEPFGFQVPIAPVVDEQSLALAAWMIWLPVISAVLCGIYAALGVKSRLPAWTTVAALAGSFVIAAVTVSKLDFAKPEVVHLFDWIDLSWSSGSGAADDKWDGLRANFALYLDGLSAYWILFVTFLGTMIAFYASEYMEEDKGTGYCRFFAGVSIFLFAMTALVLGENLIMLYLGWEGVGLASYLLIGYYYKKPEAVAAAKKAFIMNRIGDLGLALGVYLIWLEYGSLEFGVLFEALQAGDTGAGQYGGWAATLIPWCLMLGAFGKSAQFPLYVWLPDAMEGPTPVSALIHAATMVTAGIYLIARTMPFFLMNKDLGGHALEAVAWIGGLTALLAATIAMAQYDIKRVMAYSTVSQLGYMFMGLGLATSFGACYHVLTHAFFKALLFLCCGAVMHGFGGQLDLRKLGGIRRVPGWGVVCWTMLIGSLWLSGIPGSAGYFSKDEILAQAFITEGAGFRILGWIGIITAGLTAYYTFRVWFRVFTGPTHYKPDETHGHAGHDDAHEGDHDFHPHAPGVRINLVLITLSLGAIWLAVGYFVGDVWGTQTWIKNAIEHSSAGTGLQLMPAGEHPTLFGFDPHTAMYFVSGTFGLVGLTIAWWLHCSNRKAADDLRAWLNGRAWIAWLPRAMEHKWYVDEIYIATIRFPLWIAGHALYMFDRVFVDGIGVNGTARLPKIAASLFQPLYNGKLQGYATSMAGGLALVIAWIVWVWMRGSV